MAESSISRAFYASLALIRCSRCTVIYGKDNPMKDSTRDQMQGKVHEAKGKIKEQVGKLTNNPNLQGEGQDEKLGGKIQKKVGQIEKVLEK